LVANALDKCMMRRCFDLARDAIAQNELPFGSIVAIAGSEVSASTNRVRQDGDVTRHAEVVALVEAQKRLGRTSLDDCTLYTNIEPCAFCSYAIREARIGKVVYGLSSPVMGGVTRWNILGDEHLSDKLPEVFAPPPVIIREMIGAEADALFRETAPFMWAASQYRELFVCVDPHAERVHARDGRGGALNVARELVMDLLRRYLFDRFSRGRADVSGEPIERTVRATQRVLAQKTHIPTVGTGEVGFPNISTEELQTSEPQGRVRILDRSWLTD
jgi:tRNA(adenine34) deaminase